MSVLSRFAGRLNRVRRGWSTASDRAFHDSLFAGHDYNPLNEAYAGYLTIRRFSDLAEHHVRSSNRVVDLGCGPGEITCELARRVPTTQFVGVDHSVEAVRRAQRLADHHGLSNVQFETGDIGHYIPRQRVDLVTMFDAFHHLLEPLQFVQRLGEQCDRFFLIEPAGNWRGQWQKDLDLDWLTEALFVIRDRLEYQFGLPPVDEPHSQASARSGEPTEHRYTAADFTKWFDGYGLDIVGTIAGLEAYGARPYATSRLRADMSGCIYKLIVDLEALLKQNDLDLAAKHWAIYAERGRESSLRRMPTAFARVVRQPIAGPYSVEYKAFETVGHALPGAMIGGSLNFVNRSWRTWDSSAGENPVMISYHWLDPRGHTLIHDGLRTPLPHPVAPGEECEVEMRVKCPDIPGACILVVDLVHEGVTWFGRSGSPPLRKKFSISR